MQEKTQTFHPSSSIIPKFTHMSKNSLSHEHRCTVCEGKQSMVPLTPIMVKKTDYLKKISTTEDQSNKANKDIALLNKQT